LQHDFIFFALSEKIEQSYFCIIKECLSWLCAVGKLRIGAVIRWHGKFSRNLI